MINQYPAIFCFNRGASPTNITYFMFVCWRKNYALIKMKKIILPEFGCEFLQIIYGYNLNIGFYAMQKMKFVIYPPWEENYILIPEEYFLTLFFMNTPLFIIAKIFFINCTFGFSEPTELIISNLRYYYSHLFKM